MSEIILTIEGIDPLELFGENNAKLNLLRKAYPDATITSRGNSLKITGEKKDAQAAKAKFEMMARYLREHHELPVQTVLLFTDGVRELSFPFPLGSRDKV